MKKRYLLVLLLPLFYSIDLTAQSFAINTDGSTANPSALLDIKSTTKGILIPRMTKTERNSIVSPATGLMIFQTAPDSIGFHYYNGSSWSWVSSSSNGNNWKLTGNSGTDTATQFIGTTDNMALRFKINGQQAALISSKNNLFGLNAGKTSGTDTGIVAMGVAALGLNKNKNDLVAIGDSALYYNSTGGPVVFYSTRNVAVGPKTLLNNTTGFSNTGMGFRALYSNTTAGDNTAYGDRALEDNTTASANTATGALALSSNTTGYANTANGFGVLEKNTTGQLNVGLGNQALFNSISGSYNVAVGDGALLGNSASSFNTAIGHLALYYNGAFSASDNNTAVGNFSSFQHQWGNNNTSVGSYSLYNNGYGTYVTAIGDSADVLYNGLTNATAIGAKAAVNCNNCLVLGSVSGQNYATSNVNVGIGTTTPDALLHVQRGAVLFDSTIGSTPVSGGGTRMMWIPAKAAFRAGQVANSQWDDASIGYNSIAMGTNAKANGTSTVAIGYNPFASGPYSTAIGYVVTASGIYSTAMGRSTSATGSAATAIGYFTEANEDNATAMGIYSQANGFASTAMGGNTAANGNYATSMGDNTTANGYASISSGVSSTAAANYSTAIGVHAFAGAGISTAIGWDVKSKSYAGFVTGTFNDSANAANPNALTGLNRIFQIGNGLADNTRSNAVTVLQNGNTGIGILNPARMLSVATDIAVDENNTNNGTLAGSLHFGAGNSGEGIASNRFSGNIWGLDFYTNFINRLSISNSGNVGIGTPAPSATLDVNGTTTTNGLQVSNGTVITKMQSGSVTVGANGSPQMVYTYFFPVAFATATPRVFATARNAPATNFADAFSVSIRSISAIAVTFNIQRTDANTGWGQQLVVDWFAVE